MSQPVHNLYIAESDFNKIVETKQQKRIEDFTESDYDDFVSEFMQETQFFKVFETEVPIPDNSDRPLSKIIASRRDSKQDPCVNPITTKQNKDVHQIKNYHNLFKNKSITPSRLLKNVIGIIERKFLQNSKLVSIFDKGQAVQDARESTTRYAYGQSISMLDGIPYFVSEDYDIKNVEIVVGSHNKTYLCTDTSKTIETLRRYGAICCGFATSTILGSNVFGINLLDNRDQISNPYNVDYYVAGGNPGNAALVSYGICPFTIAYDKFGSLRLSSGSAGVVCLRPTHNALLCPSKFHDSLNLFWQTGIMAQSIEDLWIVYYYLASDHRAWENSFVELLSPPFSRKNLSKVSFGYFPEYTQNAEETFWNDFILFLETIIAHEGIIVPLLIPNMRELMGATVLGEAKYLSLLADNKYDCRWNNFDDILINFFICLGDMLDEKHMSHINMIRSYFKNYMEQLFRKVDIIIFLNSCTIPKKRLQSHLVSGVLNSTLLMGNLLFEFIPSLTGNPVVTLKLNYDNDTELPVTVQLMGKAWEESKLLDIANYFELLGFSFYKPYIYYVPTI